MYLPAWLAEADDWADAGTEAEPDAAFEEA